VVAIRSTGGGPMSLTDLTDVTGIPGLGQSPVSDGSDSFPLTHIVTETDLAAVLGSVRIVVPITANQIRHVGDTPVELISAHDGAVVWPVAARLFALPGSPYQMNTLYLYPGDPACFGDSNNAWGEFGEALAAPGTCEFADMNTGGIPYLAAVGKPLVLFGDGYDFADGDGAAIMNVVYSVVAV